MSTRFTSRQGSRRRTTSETVSRLDSFVRRLRIAGASDDEVSSFVEAWDETDEGWIITKAQLLRLSDADLKALIEHARREHYEHTHTDDEEAADVRRAAYAAAEADWATLGHPLKAGEVITWVGHDTVRATLAYEAELERPDQRVTVVRYLQPLVETEPRPEPADADGDQVDDETQGIAL